ncbi:uncharacterized protein LOC129598620 [Paramacrobiotus metropolitanus]|uniref:uncharacterized protein LOC129598620 n=1 Tax=Paramacrobiotus metropolitanus TaxID=2943436 RepID=UPI00244576D4|nr:uncharacterized protein LOC129598620 [Paramacrobiotus metropolitanus]XP_055352578.1 uncharacterized protein LOC129598620 [Paramacrobiotus metropolitanus]XP_055352579.1 uncharacterized protein LOC129598620 [Paramacrobiotus metropolitanus]
MTGANINEPPLHRSAETAQSRSGGHEAIQALDEQYQRLRTMLAEDKRLAAQAGTLHQQIVERDAVIAELQATVGSLRAEMAAKNQLIGDQQFRNMNLETRLAEETARSAKLLHFNATVQALFAKHPDAVGPTQMPAAAPFPRIAAAGQHPVAGVDGAAELVPALPAPVPPLPLGTIADHVETNKQPTAAPLLPVGGAIPFSGDARVAPPPALPTGQSAQLPGAPHVLLGQLSSDVHPSIVYTKFHRNSTAAATNRVSAGTSGSVTGATVPHRVEGQRSRTAQGVPAKRRRQISLPPVFRCKVCLVPHASAAALQWHACPRQPRMDLFPCGVDGCEKTLRSAAGKKRHVTRIHSGKVRPESIK